MVEGTFSDTAPQRWSVSARERRVQIGELTVTYVPDGYVELEPYGWFSLPSESNTIAENRHLLSDSGYLTGSIGSLVVAGPEFTVLIDAGFGPRTLPGTHSHPSLGAMHGGSLGQHQFDKPFDAACFTHLHEDHSGWLRAAGHPLHTLLETSPRFASRQELAENGLSGAPGWHPLADGESVVPGIRAYASPGHTRGHLSYLIESEGESLLCFGDVLHSPLQVEHPGLNSCFEASPDHSLDSRRRTLDQLAGSQMVGAGMHFGDVVFGKVDGVPGALKWVPVA